MSAELVFYVRVAFWVVLGIASLMIVTLLARFWLVERTVRREAEASLRARQLLMKALQGDDVALVPREVRRLPVHVVAEVLQQFQRAVSGPAAEVIWHVGEVAGIGERGQQLCLSRFWWRRLQGLRTLSFAKPEQRSALAARLIDDPVNDVRRAAVETAYEYPTPEVVVALARHLEDPDSQIVFAVLTSLVRSGPPAADHLVELLQGSDLSPTAVARALLVLTLMGDSRALELAIPRAGSPHDGVRQAVARAMGAFGGHRVAPVLKQLLTDPNNRVRLEACNAVGRMQVGSLAEEVAELLSDRDWQVRRRAALALGQLGPRGEVLLLRALWQPDIYAADMARHVLDLPASTIGADLRA
jgi:hypothetical protein